MNHQIIQSPVGQLFLRNRYEINSSTRLTIGPMAESWSRNIRRRARALATGRVPWSKVMVATQWPSSLDVVNDEPDSFVLLDAAAGVCWKVVPGAHVGRGPLPAPTRWFARELRALRRLAVVGPRNLTPELKHYGAVAGGAVLYLGTELIPNARHPSTEAWPPAFSKIAESLCVWHERNGVSAIPATDYIVQLRNDVSRLNHRRAVEAMERVLNHTERLLTEQPDTNIYNGLVHGDTGPHNCLQTESSVRIIDWGGSRYSCVLFDLLTAELALAKRGPPQGADGSFWYNMSAPTVQAIDNLGGGSGRHFRELLSTIRGKPVSAREVAVNMLAAFANWFLDKAASRGEAFIIKRRKTRFFLEHLGR